MEQTRSEAITIVHNASGHTQGLTTSFPISKTYMVRISPSITEYH
jgi:hypothetical protein